MKTLRTISALSLLGLGLALAACSASPTLQYPVVVGFKAVPDQIVPGASTALTWEVQGATTVSIDNGIGVVTGTAVQVTPSKSTQYTLTATNAAGSALATTSVTLRSSVPSGVVGFKVAASVTSGTAGVDVGLTLTAIDSRGVVVPGYTGTVALTANDAKATLPAELVFAAADAGVKTATVNSKVPGTLRIAAQDKLVPGLAGSAAVAIAPAAAASLVLSGVPASASAGDVLSAVVTVLDAFGNVATGYRGTVDLTADGAALQSATLSATDAGVHAFALSFTGAKSYALKAQDHATAALTSSATLAVAPLAAARLLLSTSAFTITSGDSVNLTVSAQDKYGNPTPYTGTTHWTTTDTNAGAVLPVDTAFTAADNGSHAFTVTLAGAGAQQVSVGDTAGGPVGATFSVLVNPGAAAKLVATGVPDSTTAGVATGGTLTAYDAHGNVATGYRGAITASGAAGITATLTFTAADAGVHGFSVAPTLAGATTVVLADNAVAALRAAAVINVKPADAAKLALTAGSSALAAGSKVTLTATAFDNFGNVATGYRGTLHWTSTDTNAGAALPADAAFVAADNGVHAFDVKLAGAGAQVVTAQDKALAALSATFAVQVSALAASKLAITGAPTSSFAGDAVPVLVSALDTYGNAARSYAGTVAFTSDDTRAVLPAAYAYKAGDAGQRPFGVTLGTSGMHSVTAGDGTLTASASIAVDAAATTRVDLTGLPGTATAGAVLTATATARDRFGNVTPGYRGTIALALTDAAAAQPPPYTFKAADSGVASLQVSFVTAGAQSFSVKDGGIAGASAAVAVGSAAANHCTLGGAPAGARAGVPVPLRLTAFDTYGNQATGYTGTVGFTSTDAQATLPASTTYASGDAGARSLSARLGTLGAQTITASDGALSCGASVTVSAGAASRFTVDQLAAQSIAGTASTFRVSAFDDYGNAATDYAGPATFSSTDAKASFAGGSALTAGVGTFSVVFASIGGQTITASAASGFSASAASAVHGLVYTPSASTTTALQLVADATSTAGAMVLRLVANTAFTGYSAGFTLPADPTRATVADIAQGNSLNPGTAPPAMGAGLSSAVKAFTAGLSQKAAGSGAVATDTAVLAGQSVYTVTVKPSSVVPGVIFDGANKFRAAVRDHAGNELLSQADFAIGKLELQ